MISEIESGRSIGVNMVRSRIASTDGTGICIMGSVLDAINGYYDLETTPFEGISSFRSTGSNGGKSLYFLRYFSQWNIANNRGDTSIFAFCVHLLTSDAVTDITECEQWVVWDDTVGWMVDVGINVYRCRLSQ